MTQANESHEMNVTVQTPDQATIVRQAQSALSMVDSFEISDSVTFELAADELKAIKKRASDLEAKRKSITKPLDDAKKAVMELFRGPVDVLARAEKLLKSKMLDYQREEQRKVDEARALAEKAAEEERKRQLAEAEKLRQEGKAGEAAVKEQMAETVVAVPSVNTEATKVAGVSTRKTVDFEVTDLHALVKHVAENPDLLGLLKEDTTKVRAYVRGLGMSCKLPGVRVFEKQTLSSRS